MDNCVIVGGGIIGLSLAVELNRHGLKVQVIDCKTTSRTSSVAAGGILPPPITRALHDPLEQIRHLSHGLYEPWCRQLAAETDIDVPFRRCGGIYLGRMTGEKVSLRAALDQWNEDGVSVEPWSLDQLRKAEPNLVDLPPSTDVYYLRDEVLVRPPRILEALREVLRRADVPVHEQTELLGWGEPDDDKVTLNTSTGTIEAEHCCVTAGAWTPRLLQPLGLELPVEPRRGQMVLWQCAEPLFQRVINEGPRYLIPRRDGFVLVGSTVEDVGFQGDTTDEGVRELIDFARGLAPKLREIEPLDHWAALRPASLDGKPYLGRVPGHERISIATGHFRSGIHLAPATARLLRQLICDEKTDLDLSWFSVAR